MSRIDEANAERVYSFRSIVKRILIRFPGIHDAISSTYITKYAARRQKPLLRHADFLQMEARSGNDRQTMAALLRHRYSCGTLIDPSFLRIVRRLKDDFNLKHFVETGTYQGDTSLFFSLIFDSVFTCDAMDHPRRAEFYMQENLTYETKSSPSFLLDHLDHIKRDSLFFLDAHWMSDWPLRDELAIIFGQCKDPVVIIDDFDAGNGLGFDSWQGAKLDCSYIRDLVPPDYRFCLNTWSYRNRGVVFLFPGTANYGCKFKDWDLYSETEHGLWDKQ